VTGNFVAFTDTTTGDPTSWRWDFNDDGATDSVEQSPVHEFSGPGSYIVRLTASNAFGSSTASRLVTIN